mgnify:CR=1 FL=1
MKKVFKWVLYIFIGLMVIGYIAGKDQSKDNASETAQAASSGETSPPAQPQKEIYQTTARKLFSAYDENEVATDERLKGKLVAVTGIVQSIDKDFTNSIIISLKTSNEFMPAHMQMKDSEKNTALTLKKGQKTEIICERMSRVVGTPSGRSCVFN